MKAKRCPTCQQTLPGTAVVRRCANCKQPIRVHDKWTYEYDPGDMQTLRIVHRHCDNPTSYTGG